MTNVKQYRKLLVLIALNQQSVVKSKGADIQISGSVHYRYKRYGLVMLLSHEQPAKLCFPLYGKIFTFGHDNIDSNQWNPSNDRQKIEEVGNK